MFIQFKEFGDSILTLDGEGVSNTALSLFSSKYLLFSNEGKNKILLISNNSNRKELKLIRNVSEVEKSVHS